jgi:hypothetical protein
VWDAINALPGPREVGNTWGHGAAWGDVDDVTESAGLLPDVANVWGHGAAWGDVDGDGWVDLYVATFHRPGGRPNLCSRDQRG